MIPDQERAVDPFSSYESENVNRLTRVLTAGTDKIARDSDLYVTKVNDTTLRFTDGVAVKDDVMLHVEESGGAGYHDFDVTNPLNYLLGVGEPSLMPPGASTAYLVLNYQYTTTPVVPQGEVLLLRTIANFDPNLHMFLARVTFSDTNIVDTVYQDDAANSVYRQVANLTDGYTDVQARAADADNPITNHLAAVLADYNKIVHTDPSDGSITLSTPTEYFTANPMFSNISRQWTGSPILITHNLGVYPTVQCIDKDGGGTDGELIQADIHHCDVNSFEVGFATLGPATPFDFIIVVPAYGLT